MAVDGVLIFLIIARDIGHGVLAAKFRTFDHNVLIALRAEIALFGLGAGLGVHLEQIAAGIIGRGVQPLAIDIGRAVGPDVRGDAQRVEIGHVRVGRLKILLELVDIHAPLVDLDLFAEQVSAAVFAVIVEVHRTALHGAGQTGLPGHGIDDLVAQQRCVDGVGQQDPCLIRVCLLAALQQVSLLFQLDLIGLLCLKPGRVAAPLDLRQLAVIDGLARSVEHQHRAGGLVRFCGFDPFAAVPDRIVALEVHTGDAVGTDDREPALARQLVDGRAQRQLEAVACAAERRKIERRAVGKPAVPSAPTAVNSAAVLLGVKWTVSALQAACDGRNSVSPAEVFCGASRAVPGSPGRVKERSVNSLSVPSAKHSAPKPSSRIAARRNESPRRKIFS